MSKETATALVKAFEADTKTPSAWPNVRKADVVAGLIDRIDKPYKIDQQRTPFCGPTVFFHTIATNDPDKYAQAAIDLYKTGIGKIGNVEIKPGNELIKSAPQMDMHAADWITVAALRDANNAALSPAGWFGGNAAGITRPGTLEGWFRDAGYGLIVNETYLVFQANNSTLKGEILRANALLAEKYAVMFLIHDELLYEASQSGSAIIPNHWVKLTAPVAGLVNSNDPLSFTVFTWGNETYAVPHGATALTRDDFLNHYYGFIAVKK